MNTAATGEPRSLTSKVFEFEADGWNLTDPLRDLADWIEEWDDDIHVSVVSVQYHDVEGEGHVTLTVVVDGVSE